MSALTGIAVSGERSATGSASLNSSDQWCTPKWLADALGPFDLDPCSNLGSHIQATRCALDHEDEGFRDGLKHGWIRRDGRPDSVFVNPPYSNVGPWAARLVNHQGPWVALLKLDPTTRWWAHLMTANPTVAPFRKRIRFEGKQTDGSDATTANFPSVLVYSAWKPPIALRPHLWLYSCV